MTPTHPIPTASGDLEAVARDPIYDVALESLRVGTPGLSDKMRQTVARQINKKINLHLAEVGEPRGYCKKCGTARSKAPCFKCGGDLIQPAVGWDEPRLPDIEPIRAVARQHGYAIGVHGSLEADMDLIAAPWSEGACTAPELAAHIAAAINGRVLDDKVQDKPLGRWSCCVQIDGWFKTIDLSVCPTSPASHDALIERVRTVLGDLVDMFIDYKASDLNHHDAHSAFVGWQAKYDRWEAARTLFSDLSAAPGEKSK